MTDLHAGCSLAVPEIPLIFNNGAVAVPGPGSVKNNNLVDAHKFILTRVRHRCPVDHDNVLRCDIFAIAPGICLNCQRHKISPRLAIGMGCFYSFSRTAIAKIPGIRHNFRFLSFRVGVGNRF